jgi:SSS family solute:Na+ symporter
MPIFLMVRDYPKTIYTTLVFIITSVILKFTWFDRVKKIPNDEINEIETSNS